MKNSTQPDTHPPENTGRAPRFSFFDAFNAVARSGKLGRLTGLEAKVLFSFFSYVDANGEAWPSVETLAENVGMPDQRNRIRRALKVLEDKGILDTVRVGGGAKNPTVRRILMSGTGYKTNPVETGCKSNPVGENGTGYNLSGNGVHMEGQTGYNLSGNGVQIVPPKDSLTNQLTNHQQQHREKVADVVAGDGLDGIQDGGIPQAEAGPQSEASLLNEKTLRKIGVRGKALNRIAEIPGMTPQIILREWNETKTKNVNNPQALLIQALDEIGVDLVNDGRDEAARRAADEIADQSARKRNAWIENVWRINKGGTTQHDIDYAAQKFASKHPGIAIRQALKLGILQREAERIVGPMPEGITFNEKIFSDFGRPSTLAKAIIAGTYTNEEWYQRIAAGELPPPPKPTPTPPPEPSPKFTNGKFVGYKRSSPIASEDDDDNYTRPSFSDHKAAKAAGEFPEAARELPEYGQQSTPPSDEQWEACRRAIDGIDATDASVSL